MTSPVNSPTASRIAHSQHHGASPEYAVVLAHVSKTYVTASEATTRRALIDVSVQIPKGQIVAIIGPSGCGKTTFLRLLTGEHAPDAGGSIAVLGVNPASSPATLRAHIGYVPQHYLLSRQLTVWDALHFVASLYDVPYRGRQERLEGILHSVRLERREHGHKLPRQLSGGQLRRLALACALVHEPDLVIADEPTAGLDPVTRKEIWDHFRDMRDHRPSRTFLVATQHLDEVEHCDLVLMFKAGRVVYYGPPPGLLRLAVGGYALVVEVERPDAVKAFSALQTLPIVRDIRTSARFPGVLYLTVDLESTSSSEGNQTMIANGAQSRTTIDAGEACRALVLAKLKESGFTNPQVVLQAPSYDEAFSILTK
ncbi:MAG: ABC transporter ATP-binding protein [Roseiflexus sp.]|nr:ABC transporter ATP-binding protein [Roseiflexus sp.]MCS7290725.1 ABC transporter ATP-binding protein [Roseiflexus sp.]MDW8147434.1 ABC transporter ATP-binding protein [Roseiflexaceae bacterium]MDW8233713.1 ABC transporter ATP-binding protein [Roseiflexaceae bacterium]